MEETGGDIRWNSQLERVISDEGERSLCFSWLHLHSEKRYSKLNTYISLPVIVMSTIAGSASIGSQTLFSDPQIAGVGIGLISLTVATLNTVASYFSWAKRAEAHRIASITYQKIYRFILIELALPRAERMAARDMLKVVRENMERISETAPQIPPQIIALFQSRFDKTENIAKPEITNGLDEIYVYKEEEHITTPLPSPAENKPTVKISVAV
jgi:uncharacterized membrane protein